MNFWSRRGTLEGTLFVLGTVPCSAAVACGVEQPSALPAASGGAAGASSASGRGISGASPSNAGNTASTGGAPSNAGASSNGGTNANAGTNGASGTGATDGTGGRPTTAAGGTASAGAHPTGGDSAAPSAGSANAATAGTPGTAGHSGAAAGGASSAGAAGQPVAGGGGSGASTSSLGCSAGKYLLCEDFESTAVGGIPQGWTRHGDQAAVSDDAAKRGSRSLKLGPVASAERRIYHDAALLGAAHWGRIYYKVKQPVPDAFVHSTLVSFTGDAPQHGPSEFRVIDTVKQAIDTRDVGSLHQYLYNVQVTGVNSEFSREGPYDQKFEDVWHCVEYHIEAATQSYDLYIDGKSEISFKDGAGNFGKSDIPSSFEQLRVGWVNYQQAAPGFSAWIDEIAFDDERVGCD